MYRKLLVFLVDISRIVSIVVKAFSTFFNVFIHT